MEKIEIFFGMNESVVSQPCDLLRVCRLQLCHVCPVGSRVCSPDSHVSRLPGAVLSQPIAMGFASSPMNMS